MNFIISEFTNQPKHYKIYCKENDNTNSEWRTIAKITSRKNAFALLSFIEKLAK